MHELSQHLLFVGWLILFEPPFLWTFLFHKWIHIPLYPFDPFTSSTLPMISRILFILCSVSDYPDTRNVLPYLSIINFGKLEADALSIIMLFKLAPSKLA